MTTRIEIIADGKSLIGRPVRRERIAGAYIGSSCSTASDGTFSTPGVVTLGMFEPSGGPGGQTYKVRFDHIQILTPSEPVIPLAVGIGEHGDAAGRRRVVAARLTVVGVALIPMFNGASR